MRTARALGLALALLADLACNIGVETEPDPNPCTGTFSGSVSGSGTAPNSNFSGCSVYATNGAFELHLNRSPHMITLGGGGVRPGVGTHAIGRWGASPPPPLFASYFSGRYFHSDSGTLTITESSQGRLKGSLTVSVTERTVTPVTATVTATFDATCRTAGLVTC